MPIIHLPHNIQTPDQPNGVIESMISYDSTKNIQGMALVLHPHPLFGGTMENKIVQILTKTLVEQGYITMRFNFRGVGASTGVHDHGVAESQDAARVLDYLHQNVPDILAAQTNISAPLDWQNVPIALAGFSFGTFVMAEVLTTTPYASRIQKMIGIGTACGKWPVKYFLPESLIMHGDDDEVIALSDVMPWAKVQGLPVVVVPSAGHYFHGKLHVIQDFARDYIARPVR